MTLDHVDDYPEIPISLDSTRSALKTGGWRSVRPVLRERTAPCSAGCPAGVGIASCLHLIEASRLDEALAVFSQRNPFPRITGRVCPHACQHACNLAVATADGPVSIRSIERWLGDATARFAHPTPHPATARRVAVVGSGPAGMAAAYYLTRSGHSVTVFERRDVAGGMLRHAIPSYRLPGAIVDEEIARLAAMGIEFRTGVELGRDVDLETIIAEFDAVFAATGACRERPVGIAGEELLSSGLEYLGAVRRGEAEIPGRRCAVIGGGNTALDVARVLRRRGADVTVLYRRTAAEMPAIREEYVLAEADGVRFEWLAQPRVAEMTDRGLTLTVEEMELGELDSSGRPRPVSTGATRTVEYDAVFAAVGEMADFGPFPGHLLGDDGRLETGSGGETPDPALHVGGDLVTGPATVIEAIVAGREAARAIDARLGFAHRWPADEVTDPVPPVEVNPSYAAHHRPIVDHPTFASDPLAEESLTISSCEALEEIERCLSCGHCNECGTCFVFCPDGAVAWEDGPIVDLEFCKGCGICVTECPGRAMVLVNERAVDAALAEGGTLPAQRGRRGVVADA